MMRENSIIGEDEIGIDIEIKDLKKKLETATKMRYPLGAYLWIQIRGAWGLRPYVITENGGGEIYVKSLDHAATGKRRILFSPEKHPHRRIRPEEMREVQPGRLMP